MTIKILKLKTGEEIVADITVRGDEYKLSKPFVLQMAKDNRGQNIEMQLALFPYAPYTKDHTIHLRQESVIWIEELPTTMINDYNTALENLNNFIRNTTDNSITDV